MKKRTIIVSFVVLLTLAGFIAFRAMHKEATALNDSFTKEFIAEEWIEDEFHLFESKTGQYRMLFPDHFQMISDPPEFYERQGDGFEEWAAQIYEYTQDGISYRMNIRFTNEETDLSDNILSLMLTNYAYENQHKEMKLDDTTIYHGLSHSSLDGTIATTKNPNEHKANRFFGLVLDQHSNRSVEFFYSINCYKEELGCGFNPEEHYEFALKLMKSIEFL
ncbi:hypothetical protein AB3N04_06570 [Alkalihalophilus sp. As8PL]|uniref:Uncharacterized protein n=1 Tax=Alkalihalophilus sp. As8PL TaxID=3237103 RepID=A0AB39BVQ4_9BACI